MCALEGQKFGRLTATSRSTANPRDWVCACDCGGQISVRGYKLTSGHTKSCGCLSRERFQGVNNPRYRLGPDRFITSYGYVQVRIDGEHPRKNTAGRVFEHILVVEAALGHFLPDGAVVHHIDENRQNNHISNLLLCESELEHKQIHVKLRAFKACGHEDWLKCPYCGKYDAPENMYIYPKKTSIHHHRECSTNANRRAVESRRQINL